MQLQLQAESLQNDIQYLSHAREMSNSMVLAAWQKIASLFGGQINEESLVQQIKDLQQSTEASKKEAENLQKEYESLRNAIPARKDAIGAEEDAICKEINNTKEEITKIRNKETATKRDIEKMKVEIKQTKRNLEILQSKYQMATQGFHSVQGVIAKLRNQLGEGVADAIRDEFSQTHYAGIPISMAASRLLADLDHMREQTSKLLAPERFEALKSDALEARRGYEETLNRLSELQKIQIPKTKIDIETEESERAKRYNEIRRAYTQALRSLKQSEDVPICTEDMVMSLCNFVRRLKTPANRDSKRIKEGLNSAREKVDFVRLQNRNLRVVLDTDRLGTY